MDVNYNITYRQKDKGWQYIISRKENNKWRQVASKQGFKTKKEAKSASDKRLYELKKAYKSNPDAVVTGDILLKDLHDSFISHQKLYKEYNTIKGYKNSYSFFKELHDKKVSSITSIMVQNCIDNSLKYGNLKPDTLQSYVRRMKLEFNYYIEYYNNSYVNPMLKVKLPKNNSKPKKTALTKKQLDDLLTKLEGNKFYMVVFIAAKTGCRCGEVLGLTWDDINFKNSTITINKQWKKLKDGSTGFGSTKNGKHRIVPMPKELKEKLKEYKKEAPININKRIVSFNKDSIDKYVNPILKENANITMHELRHTYITLLIANGIDFKTVAQIVGDEVDQIYKTYSHVTSDMMNKASKIINDIFK
ncbi:MAG: site-specific integrase [Clostridium sp.]|nr:site-specific integrase [Clostridium sp.]